MNEKMIIAGSGGQGIQFIGKFLASYGIRMGHQVTYIPSYGAEMRGGSTDAQVVISETEVSIPMVMDADSILLLSTLGMHKYPGRIKKGGVIFYNSDLIKEGAIKELYGEDAIYRPIEAQKIANDFGITTMVNIPFVYYYLKENGAFKKELMAETLGQMLKEKQKILQTNLKYIEYLEKISV